KPVMTATPVSLPAKREESPTPVAAPIPPQPREPSRPPHPERLPARGSAQPRWKKAAPISSDLERDGGRGTAEAAPETHRSGGRGRRRRPERVPGEGRRSEGRVPGRGPEDAAPKAVPDPVPEAEPEPEGSVELPSWVEAEMPPTHALDRESTR